MSSDAQAGDQPTLEIAHVLFADVVGYSRLSMDEQRSLLARLAEVVRSTPEYERASRAEQLLSSPSGDGFALVFFSGPEAPARCALEVAEACRRDGVPLRMGIHTGPVYRVRDLRNEAAVAGGGINLAQRVMDCGDTGHILVSSDAARYLRESSRWRDVLHDLGEWEVKHGERVHLFNLVADGRGNPATPSRAAAVGQTPAGPPQVALLYRRNVEPDGYVLALLERELRSHGYRVFVDRHLAVGVEWAREIERQLRSSVAVIPLLSAGSIHSEMVEHEIQTAHEAAQQGGTPRILPVRVSFTGGLPETLSALLDSLQYFAWGGPLDDARLVQELVRSLQGTVGGAPAPTAVPVELPPQPEPTTLEPPGGAVPLGSRFYIRRPADELFLQAVARRDSIVLVKGARQMGKTSLLARGLHQAREAGARVVLTDLQKLNVAELETADSFYRALAERLARQVRAATRPEAVWSTAMSPNLNFELYVTDHILEATPQPLLWALDEVDRLFTCDFSTDVFALFRSWHNERALDPYGPFGRLSLALAYATEAHLFITDVNQSPFNVGTRLELTDFTAPEAARLNELHGSPLRNAGELERFGRLLGGHPYLVRRGLYEMASRPMSFDELEPAANRDDGPFGDHLRRILVLLARDPDLTEAVRGLLQGAAPSHDAFFRLRSSGLLRGENAGNSGFRCALYSGYLRRHLESPAAPGA